jgi:RNA polymerase sigma factor (sigma-70 family)
MRSSIITAPKLGNISHMTTAPDDLTLTSAVAAGDESAEEIFAERFRDKLIFLAGKRGVPAVDCEDVADETLIAAIDQLRRGLFRGESSISTWLGRILTGKAADFWRKVAKGLRQVPLDGGEEATSRGLAEALVSSHSDPLQRLLVQEILGRMPATHRRILLLNQNEGYTTKEIGKMVGWPPGSVGRVLAKAKAMFRDSVLGGEESGNE